MNDVIFTWNLTFLNVINKNISVFIIYCSCIFYFNLKSKQILIEDELINKLKKTFPKFIHLKLVVEAGYLHNINQFNSFLVSFVSFEDFFRFVSERLLLWRSKCILWRKPRKSERGGELYLLRSKNWPRWVYEFILR